ncbi:MAG: outer membrane beta-barrel protein [Pseudomonadota bacterium]
MITANADVRDVNNNKQIQAATISNSSSNSSNIPGFVSHLYATAQVGYADTHMKAQVSSMGNAFDNNGITGRVAVGYKFDQNLAVELGYLQLKSANYKSLSDMSYSGDQYALDIAGKGSLPITNNVNLYGKVGIAYLTTRLEAQQYGQSSNINDQLGIAKHKWAPEVAVGMGYDITPNVTVDTSFTHIQPIGNNRPGNIDFLAVGVGYHFG